MRSSFGIGALGHVFSDSTTNVRRRIISIYILLITFNIVIWATVLFGFAPYPALYGTAVLAYTFGLRHAVDADHISAIDNVTRKLMQENKRPVAIGFFFGLGHSTIVVILGLVIAIAASLLKVDLQLQSVAGAVGTGASAFFLYLIAFLNAIVLMDVFRAFRKIQRRFLARFFGPLFRITTKSGHMYPVVTYYDRQYGNDEITGTMDFSLSASRDLQHFATSRVTTSSMPLPTQFPDAQGNSIFYSDYTGLAVDTAAHPIWKDTRNKDLSVCPGTDAPGIPPKVCAFTAANGFPANDQIVLTTTKDIPTP